MTRPDAAPGVLIGSRHRALVSAADRMAAGPDRALPPIPVALVPKTGTLMPTGIGMRIKRLRRKHHLTQAELAKLVDVHRVYIARLETPDGAADHRSPSLALLEKLARVFKCSVGDLLGEKRRRK
jgi:DNA-binding XRE family transcriptional regulator